MITLIYELPFSGVNHQMVHDVFSDRLSNIGKGSASLQIVYYQEHKLALETDAYADINDAPRNIDSSVQTSLENLLGCNVRFVEMVNGTVSENNRSSA